MIATFPCRTRSRCALLILTLTLASCAGLADASRKTHAASKATGVAKSQAAKKGAPSSPEAGEFANFTQWREVSEFIDHMVNDDGFDRAALESTLSQARYVEKAVQLMKPAPPGRPKNWQAYRARFVEPVRIDAGVAFWNQYADALSRAEQEFGVPAEIIVGILGVETIYGRNTGNFRVMDAIATLAFAYPDTPTRDARMAYFRRELESTLQYARDAQIDPFSLTGSYAGAIGLPQFMPSSIQTFAVDFDGDGRIDLRNSPIDAIGSVANFLRQHGWRSGEPVAYPVLVSDTNTAWYGLLGQGLKAGFSLPALEQAGVTPRFDPPADLQYGLIDLQNGNDSTEYWIGTDNFFAITQYNRSYFYAMSVMELGRAVRSARTM